MTRVRDILPLKLISSLVTGEKGKEKVPLYFVILIFAFFAFLNLLTFEGYFYIRIIQTIML